MHDADTPKMTNNGTHSAEDPGVAVDHLETVGGGAVKTALIFAYRLKDRSDPELALANVGVSVRE